MSRRRLAVLAGAALLCLGPVRGGPEAASPTVVPASFASLGGFAADDLGAAFATFRTGCPAVLSRSAGPGPGLPPPPGLVAACREALASAPLDRPGAERFFQDRFEPLTLAGATGFLTGYYEPVLDGVLDPHPDFTTPLLARPSPEPAAYPDRAAIEDGALGTSARPLVFLRDPVAAFVVQVQGSARVRLPDGRRLRVAFDGRNGHPYVSVGRLLSGRLGLPPAAVTADRLSAWLREHPDEGRDLMRRNPSYIFFRIATELPDDAGPIGAAGVPLTPGRSLAVDRRVWAYGLPVWLEGTLPDAAGGETALSRLLVAQDAGAAIVGPARADLFVGTGQAAGELAGLVRQPVRFTVLWPRGDPAPIVTGPEP